MRNGEQAAVGGLEIPDQVVVQLDGDRDGLLDRALPIGGNLQIMIFGHVLGHELLHTPTYDARFDDCGAYQCAGYLL